MIPNLYPNLYMEDVFSIPYQELFNRGVKALIFDIDNTLVAHGADSNEKVDRFFSDLHSIGFKTFLLSNNNEERIKRFCKNINTKYISDADKPNPKAFKEALKIMNVSKDHTIVIGDTTFTDIRGANRADIPSILVKYIGYYIKEKKGIKRTIEKWILFFFPLIAKQRRKALYRRISS